MTFIKKLSILTSEMKLVGIYLSPYQFLPCFIHKLMIQPFKVECFSTKMLKFQQYDLITHDISADFRILSGMWNSFVTSYPCSKFQHDMTINNGVYFIFPGFCFVYFFDKRQKSQWNDVINFM